VKVNYLPILTLLYYVKGVIMTKQEEKGWCPQHGYPEPCAKCNGMTKAEWDKFFESLAKAVEPLIKE